MIEILRNRTYRHLFAAQVLALLGTGLATVALGLLAFEIAGADAGVVLGTALAIKMVAYVVVAPIVGAFVDRLPRRALLVGLDLVRAVVALVLPLVDQVWQVYVLIFVLQSASAAFTPTFQATIPELLPDEKHYTRALSLSRLAYDLESLASPALAAALLTVISFYWLFAGTALGFVASAVLVVSVMLPQPVPVERTGGIYAKTTWGMRIYLRTPRLQGLLAINLAAAAASSMVIVNTVVLVRSVLGRSSNDVAIALATFGFGSMVVALALPRVLERVSDRPVMLAGASMAAAALVGTAFLASRLPAESWTLLLAAWWLLGASYAAMLTPSGRLLRRSAQPADRPAVFAAQFALSHVCWLITYPVAGWLGAAAGMASAMAALGGIALIGLALAAFRWPAIDLSR